MKVNTKVRYGMRAILQVAESYGEDPVSISTIAETQEISGKEDSYDCLGHVDEQHIDVGEVRSNGAVCPADTSVKSEDPHVHAEQDEKAKDRENAEKPAPEQDFTLISGDR